MIYGLLPGRAFFCPKAAESLLVCNIMKRTRNCPDPVESLLVRDGRPNDEVGDGRFPRRGQAATLRDRGRDSPRLQKGDAQPLIKASIQVIEHTGFYG